MEELRKEERLRSIIEGEERLSKGEQLTRRGKGEREWC
jgi:hypothetical protein